MDELTAPDIVVLVLFWGGAAYWAVQKLRNR